MNGSKFAQRCALAYMARYGAWLGLERREGRPRTWTRADPALLRRVARAWGNARHAPTDDVVRLHYGRLIRETDLQYRHMLDYGLKVILYEGPAEQQPYRGYEDMVADIETNRRLVIWPHDTHMPADHPLLRATSGGVTANIQFRTVHDVLGHALGHDISIAGEEATYAEQTTLYSRAAWPALASEIRGQNAWLFYGPHLFRADGSLPKRGDADYIPWTERPYPEQKAVILPPEFWVPVVTEEAGAPDNRTNGSLALQAAV
ncbi:hypothetical protein [Tautonia sociabilis]|uniref:Uncharacterized protein n=1 Tax=Tautonia sociabilis TaxID=2080755 RepID=A0A432MKR6_9BACT|nr:hypothetical protein [Tautonia sociabilis]RUL88002.1 hypothetical protein TsocGM_09785 [Tautonia sociabilis]